MPGKTFDENKHDREQGKFAPIPKGSEAELDAYTQPGEKTREAGRMIQKQFGTLQPELTGRPVVYPANMQRPPDALKNLGSQAQFGYRSTRRAIDALHSSQGLQAMHHHGRAIQDHIKALKHHGARPEELEKLRHGLSALHAAVSGNDPVKAHEALTQLQHGFYHAHSSLSKEGGGVGGTFPMLGTPADDQAEKGRDQKIKKDWDEINSRQGLPDIGQQNAIGRQMKREKTNFKSVDSDDRRMFLPATPQQSPVTVNLHTAPVNNNAQDAAAQFKDILVEAMRATKPVQVNVPPAQVSVQNKVNPTPVHVDVDVNPTPVKFEATVQPSEVKVVHQDAPKAPDVHVHINPTPVTVEAKPGEVTVKLPERKPRDVEFKTDKDGKLIGMKEKV